MHSLTNGVETKKMNVANLLHLKDLPLEDEDELSCSNTDQPISTDSSNSSSRESPPLSNYIEDQRASSTSCSEDSFEISDTNSYASTLNKNKESTRTEDKNKEKKNEKEDLNQNQLKEERPKSEIICQLRPTTSYSMDSFLIAKEAPHRFSSTSIRDKITQELEELDTGLPQLDFASLEQKLSTAAKEHEMLERRLLGEEVRRRLALQADQYLSGPSPPVHTRPQKSNYAQRLAATKNLQVCYMNDLDDDEEDEDEEDFYQRSDFIVPKSKSTPNFQGDRKFEQGSALSASELAKKARNYCFGLKDRLAVLTEEAHVMLNKAKEVAKLQLEVEKQASPTSTEKSMKYSRIQLSKLRADELKRLHSDLQKRINAANTELVSLLIEKDSLYMAQDSMLVDVEDLIQHESCSNSMNLPPFLCVECAQSPISPSQPNKKPGFKWKLFKK
uniref:Schwannomin interacting protein 1 C-terminal domain-containing protein n=1 Tax=Acrobeloides nanus TaxID=290746 RepID=A0A914CI69_9BILA